MVKGPEGTPSQYSFHPEKLNLMSVAKFMLVVCSLLYFAINITPAFQFQFHLKIFFLKGNRKAARNVPDEKKNSDERNNNLGELLFSKANTKVKGIIIMKEMAFLFFLSPEHKRRRRTEKVIFLRCKCFSGFTAPFPTSERNMNEKHMLVDGRRDIPLFVCLSLFVRLSCLPLDNSLVHSVLSV